MSRHLQVPSELEHLIEKREIAKRREAQRRGGSDRRDDGLDEDFPPVSAIDEVRRPEVEEDQRSGTERREEPPRRAASRRETDPPTPE